MTTPVSLELLLHENVGALLDNLAALLRIQAVFFSADGRVLKRGRGYDNSGYCTLMQQKRFGLAPCLRLDEEKQRECRKFGRPLSYTCHAGLGEIIAPVTIYGENAGFVVFGQFRTTETPPHFLRQEEEFSAYRRLPLIAGEEIGNLMSMLSILIDYIVSRELVTFGKDLRFFRLNHFLTTNLMKKITLKEAARHLNCSESALTHYLRDIHGTSFKRMLIEKRIGAAERFLKEHPDAPVKEMAAAAGCSDPHYFARLYRKIRNRTPRMFRNLIQSGSQTPR